MNYLILDCILMWANKEDPWQSLQVIDKLAIILSLVLLYHISVRCYNMAKAQNMVVRLCYNKIISNNAYEF